MWPSLTHRKDKNMLNDITYKRKAAYNQASPAIQDLYGDVNLGSKIGVIVSTFGLNDIARGSLIGTVGDTILGIIPRREFVQSLVTGSGISSETAQKIDAEISQFFSQIQLAPQLPEINPDTREKLELRPQSVPHMPTAAPVEDPGARPLTREEVLRTLAPKRTLASDIESLRQQGAVAEGYTTPQQTEDKE